VGLDYYEQLAMLKGMTVRSGAVHEAQVVQLRNYPLLLSFTETAETHIGEKLVVYNITSTKFKKTKKSIAAMDKIVDLTRKILWDDTDVVFNVNGNPVRDTRAI
jgi:hypothetical protein